MLDWIKKRRSAAVNSSLTKADAPKRPGRPMTGQYLLLYNYLENRYADTVVLTFSEIEDLLGFPLPEQARQQREWWLDAQTGAGANHADSWILASRTAIPDLKAKTVMFERAH
jgi:hypothetical protein